MDHQSARARSRVAGHNPVGLLKEQHPGRYHKGQLRALHPQIAAWRAQYGPGREVIFPQLHTGEAAQSDFTHIASLGITLVGGVPRQHRTYHLGGELVNPGETSLLDNYCVGETSRGLLIQAGPGNAGGTGAWRTNRSG